MPLEARLGCLLPEAEPDVSFIPLMQRRRLSPMARAAVAAAWPCMGGQRPLPLICCSLHGETYHCFAILTDISKGEEVSPSRFALSVHGAVGGLLSQFSANHSPCVALAPGGEGYPAALLEAAGFLSRDSGSFNEVLVIWYEQPLPELYRGYDHDPPSVMGLAVRLSSWQGDGGCLTVSRASGGAHAVDGDPLLKMIEGFGNSTSRWTLPALSSGWFWEVEDA